MVHARVRRWSVALAAGLLATSAWGGVAVVATDGAVRAGDEVTLEVAADGGDELEIEAPAARLVGRPVALGPGRWQVRLRTPEAGTTLPLTLRTGPVEEVVTLPLEAWPDSAVALPPTIDAAVGGPRASVGVPAGARVGASEGLVGQGGAWAPGPDPFPRAVPLLVAPGDDREALPAATVVRLRARPRLPVRTEPGARVSVVVGRRSYGPFVADEGGVAQATAEVRPGESTATLVLEDAAGNVQKSEIALGGDPRPALAALPELRAPGQDRAPRVHLFGVRADGRPWAGDPPECLTSVGARARVVSVGPGRWTAVIPRVPDDAAFDVRVDCTLDGRARTTVRLPAPARQPDQLVLRAVPPELSADVPRAQLQAALETATGERLPATGITLHAELGAVEEEPGDGGAALRATYDGAGAVAAGGDTVTARWAPTPGEGPPMALVVAGAWAADGSHVRVRARVLDLEGRPLSDVAVRLSAGAGTVDAVSDATGWATAAVEARPGPAALEAAVGALVRRAALPRGGSVGAPAGASDLETRLRVPIRAGVVRRVFLTTEPRTLVLTGPERARVVIRLEDRDGNPVPDASLELSANAGVVTRPRQRTDGAYEALWAPPPGMAFGRVRISARSRDGTFSETSTELDVVPREVRTAPGLSAGWLAGPRGLSSPLLRLTGDVRIPGAPGALFVRGWAGVYGEQAATTDTSGAQLEVDVGLLPIGVGAISRQERGRLAGWAGATVVAAPYRMEARFDQVVPRRGVGFAAPGFEVVTGGGWRLRSGELTAEVGYLFLSIDEDTVGWRGPIGGFHGSLGYRLVY